MRYAVDTGEIIAQIQCSPGNLDALATDGTAFVDGDADPRTHWVDDGEFKEREAVEAPATPIPFMPSESPVSVVEGLPAGSYVRVRGTANMPYDARIVQTVDGALPFVPELPGRYVAQLVGQYSAPDFSFEVVPLAEFQSRRQAEVSAKKAEQLAGGFLWNGKRWDADAQAQANVTSTASAVAAGMELPEGFFWTSFDNEDVEIDGAGIAALSAAMMTFIFSTHAYARSLKESIEAQATNEAVSLIDIQSGWPA